MDLLAHSISVILNNQDKSGAYIACPNFPTYHYCWLRDGSFTAYAMDRSGYFESSDRFYRWVGMVIERYSSKVAVLAEYIKNNKKPDSQCILNTRFTLDGFEEGENGWGNFQIDGYGSWLWGLAEHAKLSGDYSILSDLAQPIETTIRYLQLAWKLPNYDCWEEHPNFLHPYSLATTYGGLAAILELQKAGVIHLPESGITELLSNVKQFLLENSLADQRFAKHILPSVDGASFSPDIHSGVDASLLGLATPYNVFPLDDARICLTIETIEKDLWLNGGGVYRYKADVYYGGGEWILLAGWLGWYYTLAGQHAKASQLKRWIESTADAQGNLPEQVSEHLLAPAMRDHWIKEWGPVATPLLWSHAMYIILTRELLAESRPA